MRDIAISVNNVSKCYRIFDNQGSRLLGAVLPKHTQGMQEIWALKDINFEVKRGETVAIIGRNGGGKSTLLEILTGTLTPTTGSVKVYGRVCALLELGSGFNPEYSGRDNAILNGLLMGLSKDEVLSRFEEIEAFAEIGKAIDRPVKNYSSGMMMRLAFAVQVALDPDILIVDEALSVGDYFFQQKCLSRIRELRESGTTLIFVSHDITLVRDLCHRAFYLRCGEMVYEGDSNVAIWHFLQENNINESVHSEIINNKNLNIKHEDFLENLYWINDFDDLNMSKSVTILGVDVLDSNDIQVSKVKIADQLTIRTYMRANIDGEYTSAIELKNRYGQVVTSNGSYTLGLPPLRLRSGEVGIFEMKITCMLEAGQYSFQSTVEMDAHEISLGVPVAISPWLGPISLDWEYGIDRAPFLGMFGVPVSAKFLKLIDIKSPKSGSEI